MAARRRAKQAADHPLAEKAHQKWAGSGLSDAHAKTLRLMPVTGEEVKAALGADRPQAGGVLIPYFDLDGKPTSFFRIRYLEPLPGFAGTVEKPQRYVQKAGTLNEVYLPPLLDTTWREVAEDASVPIYITEGEFKAACGCAHGLATIGLGGVDVYRAGKRGVELLPQLAEITWTNRNVVIVFDSDAASNPNVVRAQRSLAQLLVAKGALPAIASLPVGKDGTKQGLDDFVVAHGPEALIDVLKDAPAFPEAQALWEMNEQVVYIRDPGLVIERATGQRMDPGRFQGHHYANRHYLALEQGKNGNVIAKRKKLATRWVEWEHRAEAARLTYAPGKGKTIDGAYNVWAGWGCEPRKGDISPWSWLLDHLFKGEPEARQWFERWCAYPIQYPGTKLYTASVVWGAVKGTGKSFVAYSLMGIYGRNAIEIKNKDLKGGFNSWAENRQFVYGDEISGNEARVDAEWLKGLITQPVVRINAKFLPEFVIPDCMNFMFSSNKPDALFVEDGDRRYFVHEVVVPPLERAFYDRYDEWLGLRHGQYHGPGREYLFHHLLNLDLGDFHPRSEPPLTRSKRDMIMNGKSDIALWVTHLLEDPTPLLRQGFGDSIASNCDLYTARQLLKAYDQDKTGRVSEPGMGRALATAQVRKVNEGTTVNTKVGIIRLYAVRNADMWVKAAPKEIAAHYNRFFAP